MLDRNLPFGEVHGDDTHGVKYYQNGKHFDGEGYEVDFSTGQRIEKKPPPAKKAKKEVEETDDETPGDIVVNGINLSAVARGEASDIPATKVKEAVEEHFGVKPKNLAEAIKVINGEEIA